MEMEQVGTGHHRMVGAMTDPLSARLDQIEQLLQDITPGEWDVSVWTDAQGIHRQKTPCVMSGGAVIARLHVAPITLITEAQANAEFIALCHNTIRDLLTELRRLQPIRTWQPIATAAKEWGSGPLLGWVVYESGADARAQRIFWNDDRWETCDGFPVTPTYWQPLPDPPALGSDGISGPDGQSAGGDPRGDHDHDHPQQP